MAGDFEDALSAARELFAHALNRGFPIGSDEASQLFAAAAARWRSIEQHCLAGYAMSLASRAAFGDGTKVAASVTSAMRDFQNCVAGQEPDSLEALVALQKWRQELVYLADRTTASSLSQALQQELAQRLMKSFGHSPHADSYLVRGFIVTTDMCVWTPAFPESEVMEAPSNSGLAAWQSVCRPHSSSS
jgi:hypothetical protein